MIQYTGSYTDHYQLSMSLVYFKSQMGDEEAVYDYFFRKLPFNEGYVIFAGLPLLEAFMPQAMSVPNVITTSRCPGL